MTLTDASARKAAFARAARVARRGRARACPIAPSCSPTGATPRSAPATSRTATLAYRRALAIDGGNARARHNLAWLRSRQPDAFRPPAAARPTRCSSSTSWPRARRLLVGAARVRARGPARRAVGRAPPPRARRRSRVLPLAVWIAMLASLVARGSPRRRRRRDGRRRAPRRRQRGRAGRAGAAAAARRRGHARRAPRRVDARSGSPAAPRAGFRTAPSSASTRVSSRA